MVKSRERRPADDNTSEPLSFPRRVPSQEEEPPRSIVSYRDSHPGHRPRRWVQFPIPSTHRDWEDGFNPTSRTEDVPERSQPPDGDALGAVRLECRRGAGPVGRRRFLGGLPLRGGMRTARLSDPLLQPEATDHSDLKSHGSDCLPIHQMRRVNLAFQWERRFQNPSSWKAGVDCPGRPGPPSCDRVDSKAITHATLAKGREGPGF